MMECRNRIEVCEGRASSVETDDLLRALGNARVSVNLRRQCNAIFAMRSRSQQKAPSSLTLMP